MKEIAFFALCFAMLAGVTKDSGTKCVRVAPISTIDSSHKEVVCKTVQLEHATDTLIMERKKLVKK